MATDSSEKLVGQVLNAVAAEVKKLGYGGLQRTADALGRNRNFLAHWRRRNSLGMANFFDVAKVLGREPAALLAEMLYGVAENRGPIHPWAEKILERLGEASQAGDRGTISAEWLEALDLERWEDPDRVLEKLYEGAPRVPSDLKLHYLGVTGSTFRSVEEQASAEMVLRKGLTLARQQRDLSSESDFLQRLTAVAVDDGSFTEALLMAYQAVGAARLGEATFAEGKALAAAGTALFALERDSEALVAYRYAADLFTTAHSHYRFVCLQGSGYCYKRIGDLAKALELTRLADRELKDLGPSWTARNKWLKAEINRNLGNLNTATALMSEVASFFASLNYGDYLLATLDLVELYLISGLADQAQAAAEVARPVMFRVENPLIQAALQELIRGCLTAERIARVRGALQVAQGDRQLWRSLNVKS